MTPFGLIFAKVKVKGGETEESSLSLYLGASRMVVGTGFEPVKAMPADLQSAPVGHLGTPPAKKSLHPAKAMRVCQSQKILSYIALSPGT